MTELKRPLRAGKIALVPAADPVGDPARLRIALFDADGNTLGNVSISAADVSDAAETFALFAFQVEEERRKERYLERYPLSAGAHNRARVELEPQYDFDDWVLRQRRGRDRDVGIADAVLRASRLHR